MNYLLDLIVIAIIAAVALISARRGFVRVVIELAGFIAARRGLDAELMQIAGLFHDYAAYKTGTAADHAHCVRHIVFLKG